jgi:flagellum-specific peptidoglycan hydrolase FlgJ
VQSVRKPWWKQATALVTVSTGGAITGFTFVPGAAATMTTPTSVPVHLLALEKAAAPVHSPDAGLRSAIVNVAGYYLRLAQTRTPAEMEAIIWGKASVDGTDHGPSCAAFASLTLELAAQAVGEQSWVVGGSTYPWPLHEWADVRVNANPDSLGITSMVQDAQAHQRWHPLGDGYQAQPGDWVVFDGHVEVVTRYAGGVLDSIGADSLPGLTVNAHSFPDPLAQQGVEGFVDNGHLGTSPAASGGQAPAAAQPPRGRAAQASHGTGGARGPGQGPQRGLANVPGTVIPTAAGSAPAATAPAAHPKTAADHGSAAAGHAASTPAPSLTADIPGDTAPAALTGAPGDSGGGTAPAAPRAARAHAPYRKYIAPQDPSVPGTRAQQAFINQIAPGAIAAQQRFGVPAAVTIAQAIEESSWGNSQLAAHDYNLFGIKGSGPAGSITLPTQEYENGQWVTVQAQFRAYHNISESISDHAELLATSSYYQRAMADRGVPDAFAHDLTGVYATDPEYGANLVALMRLYNLYRFDAPSGASHAHQHSPAPAASHKPADQPVIPGIVPAMSPGSAAQPATGTAPASAATPAASAIPGSSASAGTSASAGAPVSPSASGQSAASKAPRTARSGTGGPGTVRSGKVRSGTVRSGTVRSGTGASGRAAVPGSVTIPGNAPIRTGTTPYGPGGAHANTPAAAQPGRTTGARASRPTAANTAARRTRATSGPARSRAASAPARSRAASAPARSGGAARVPGVVTPGAPRFQPALPAVVATAFFAKAKAPLARAEQLHRDVAGQAGIPWQILAACDWMECHADPRYSPVNGERLGSHNPDGTVFATKSQALAQCAVDLTELALAVYGLDLTAPRALPVRSLADVFAAFRWGALLRRHRVSAMEFPYSVAGLTGQHLKMHWPAIDDPEAPDRPGARFRMPFGALPVVLSLRYPATV